MSSRSSSARSSAISGSMCSAGSSSTARSTRSGCRAGELDHEPAAEAVSQPRGALDAERVSGLDEIGEVLARRPTAAGTSSGRDRAGRRRPRDVRAAARRELCEASAVPGDAVQADDGRAGRVTPLCDVQHRHCVAVLAVRPRSGQTASTIFPKCWPSSRSCAAAASASGNTSSITGRQRRVGKHAQEPVEVVGAAHRRAQQRLPLQVQGTHLDRHLRAARAAEDDHAPTAVHAVERLLPRRSDRVEHEVRHRRARPPPRASPSFVA